MKLGCTSWHTLWAAFGVILLFLQPASLLAASKAGVASWQDLLGKNKVVEARKLCMDMANDNSREIRVEAHKCLFNIELRDANVAELVLKKDKGSICLLDGFGGKALDMAIAHLDQALALSPSDLSVHKARLYIAVRSPLFREAPAFLKQALVACAKESSADDWLPYMARLFESELYTTAIEFGKVLEDKYPNDHRVIANIGAMYAMLEKDEEALGYAKKAVDLNPNDPINNWNLALLYNYTDRISDADKYYKRAISLYGNSIKPELQCAYAKFVRDRLMDRAKGCKMILEYCSAEETGACK